MKRLHAAFETARRIVWERFPDIAASHRWIACMVADYEHIQRRRQYAHMGHIPGTICFAVASDRLPLGNLYGLAFHEFGHLIAYGGGEKAADEAIRRHFGLEIRYDRGAATVEWVDPGEVHAQAR